MRRVLFVRIGWMRFYNGSIPGDLRPIGGGKYNKKKIGHEVYNFRVTENRIFGFFQPPMQSNAVALERIDTNVVDSSELDNVLIVFVATRPTEGGQFIVGWYNNATVYRNHVDQSPGKPQGYGHFCQAQRDNSVFLPDADRLFQIPHGKGGMGTANVCYPRLFDGSSKHESWMIDAIQYIDGYSADNLVDYPEADAEIENIISLERAIAESQGQGFARTPQERKAIEICAMKSAKKYFRGLDFTVEDVSARRSYDLDQATKS